MVTDLVVVPINSQACFIKSTRLDRHIALIVYSDTNKQWVATEFDGPYLDKTLMAIAKFVHEQNQADNPKLEI